MTPSEMDARIVRYGELHPCKTAFIDAHTPGSDQKENFTIIGGGVSESPDQHVHITIPHGFNIGAAGQPPKCRNSMHNHRTAEVFFVLKGRWRFFWGEKGDAGEVIWAPHVIEDAKAHGLILGENGKLYDSKKGERLPEGVKPMPLLSKEELAEVDCPSAMDVIGGYVRRYLDMVALAEEKPVKVIGAEGLIRDKPGFEVDFLTRASATQEKHEHDKPSVLMPVKGHWRVAWDGGSATLAPGDTMSVPEGLAHSAVPSMTGEAALFHVIATDDAAGPTWKG